MRMTLPAALRRAAPMLALSLSLVALAAPHPARAGDAQCLWDHTAKANRDAFFAAYPQKGPAAVGLILGSDQKAALALPRACGVDPAKDRFAGEALSAYATRTASAVVLKGRFKVEPTKLRAAYMAIPAAGRARIAAVMLNPARTPDDQAFIRTTYAAVARKLAINDRVAAQQLSVYLSSSAVLDWASAQF
jgi:hypothetical protein